MIKARNPTVILMRHCESEFNKHEVQNDVKPDLILCSPLRRCVETFTHLNVDGPVIFTTLCREHKVDVCDFFDHEDPQVLDCEPVLLQRVERFKDYLKRLGESFKTILVISHGDFIWYLTSRVMGGERYGQWQLR